MPAKYRKLGGVGSGQAVFRRVPDKASADKVFDAHAERLEDDAAGRDGRSGSSHYFAKFREDPGARKQHVAGFIFGAFSRLDNQRSSHDFVIQFARGGADRADAYHQGVGLEPFALQTPALSPR